jgi:hypothetical protein
VVHPELRRILCVQVLDSYFVRACNIVRKPCAKTLNNALAELGNQFREAADAPPSSLLIFKENCRIVAN